MLNEYQIDILKKVQYRDWVLHVDNGMAGRAPYLQWKWFDRCSKTGEIKEWASRKWVLSEYMVRSELVATAFKAVLTALEHEAREFFQFDGKVTYNPHVDVIALNEVSEREEVRS